MEEKDNTQEPQQQADQLSEQQPNEEQPVQEEKKPPLMPGQEREDELDLMGGALFNLAKNGIEKVKQLFVAKKVE